MRFGISGGSESLAKFLRILKFVWTTEGISSQLPRVRTVRSSSGCIAVTSTKAWSLFGRHASCRTDGECAPTCSAHRSKSSRFVVYNKPLSSDSRGYYGSSLIKEAQDRRPAPLKSKRESRAT